MKPYIGVSGFMSQAEVRTALASFPDCGRQLMIGVLASSKTLVGQTNRYPLRYPTIKAWRGIFVNDVRCLNLLHYSADRSPSQSDLACLHALGGPALHGMQFNGAWPSPHNARVARWAFHWRIILQVRGFLSGDAIVRVLRPYRDIATDVLLDSSGGSGHALDIELTRRWVDDIRSANLGFGIGIAGGLCAETIPDIAALMREGVSIDAEGRLRDDADDGGNLDIDKVRAYLDAASKALS